MRDDRSIDRRLDVNEVRQSVDDGAESYARWGGKHTPDATKTARGVDYLLRRAYGA